MESKTDKLVIAEKIDGLIEALKKFKVKININEADYEIYTDYTKLDSSKYKRDTR